MSHLGLKLESEPLQTENEELSVNTVEIVVTPINIGQLFDKISPLDLIYFRGTEIVSDLIMKVSKLTTGEGGYSHVGLVVNRDLLPSVEALEPGRWYVWEAILSSSYIYGTDGILDIETSKGFFGSQIRDLEDVILAHTAGGGDTGGVRTAALAGDGPSSSISWGELKDNPWNRGRAEQSRLRRIFYKIHQTYYHTPFDASPISCFGAPFKCLRPVRNLSDRLLYNVDYVSYINDEIDRVAAPPSNEVPVMELMLDTTEAVDATTSLSGAEVVEGVEGTNDVVEGTEGTNGVEGVEGTEGVEGVVIEDAERIEGTSSIIVGNNFEPRDVKCIETLEANNTEGDESTSRPDLPPTEFISSTENPDDFVDPDAEGGEPADADVDDAKSKIDFTRYAGKIRTLSSNREATHQDLLKIMERAHRKNKNMKVEARNFDPSKIPMLCSELVALFYILSGIIDKKYDPRDVLPVDLYSDKDIDGLKAVTEWPRPIDPRV